jgi:hypothetical protein
VAIAKITGQGLTSIAILVTLLWACVIGERVITNGASSGTTEALRAMRVLRIRNRREPAAAPAQRFSRRLHPSLG